MYLKKNLISTIFTKKNYCELFYKRNSVLITLAINQNDF